MSAPLPAGPWMVEPINNGETFQVTTSEATGFAVICEVESEAVAHLIAAAPDLHAALIAAKQELWMTLRHQWNRADFDAFPVVVQINRALTKADGKARAGTTTALALARARGEG